MPLLRSELVGGLGFMTPPDRRFAGIAQGANFVNLSTGKPGVNSGTPTAKILHPIGAAVRYNGTNDVSAFAGCSIANDASVTAAGIMILESVTGFHILYTSSNSTNTGAALYLTNDNPTLGFSGAVVVQSTLSLSIGVPYFMAASVDANQSAFLVTRLDNGVSLNYTAGGGASGGSTPDGTHIVGNAISNNLPAQASLSAMMFAGRFTPLAIMQKWSNEVLRSL